MKKILLTTLLSLTCATAFAAESTAPQVALNPEFAKVQKLIQAKDAKGAYAELERLAKTGNAQALYNLGSMTLTGQGATKDQKKALQYIQESSDKGYSYATFTLSNSYENGDLGLTKDSKKAREYLEKASNQGFDEATVKLAFNLFEENKPASDQRALKLLDPLIKRNVPYAIYTKSLYDISSGVKTQNVDRIKTALNSLEKIANNNFRPAQMYLANLLVSGKLVDQNLPEAKRIYTALTSVNYPKAREALASVNKLIADKGTAKPSTAVAKPTTATGEAKPNTPAPKAAATP